MGTTMNPLNHKYYKIVEVQTGTYLRGWRYKCGIHGHVYNYESIKFGIAIR